MVEQLRGKKSEYEVTLHEIKTRVLPELNDEFAGKMLPGKNLADLRHVIEHDIEHGKEHEVEQSREAQILEFLNKQTAFEVPPSLLRNETRRTLGELVHRNRERGITDDMLKEKEKELIEGAAGIALHRLRTNFILGRIAEKENIAVSREDMDDRIRQEARRYNVSVDKMRRELEEHDGLNALAEQVLLGKTLAFLKANVSVKTTEPPLVSDQKS